MSLPPQTLAGVKVIFFDAVGTLLHLRHAVGWHYREVARRQGLDVPEEKLTAAFHKVWKAMPPPPETRVARPDDDKGWWKTLVGKVLDECQATGPHFSRDNYFESLYTAFAEPEVWDLYPDAAKVLDRLKGKVEFGIISNFDGRLRRILEDLRVARDFQHWVISSEVGADKPSPWIFQHALEKAGITAAEAAYVGDDPECDWAPAEAAGLRVFRLERPQGSILELVGEFRI